jgi:hypothetical protein
MLVPTWMNLMVVQLFGGSWRGKLRDAIVIGGIINASSVGTTSYMALTSKSSSSSSLPLHF